MNRRSSIPDLMREHVRARLKFLNDRVERWMRENGIEDVSECVHIYQVGEDHITGGHFEHHPHSLWNGWGI